MTFRFRAPEATKVELAGEIMQGKGPQAMSKDENGIWTSTVNPLPEIWISNFRVQAVDVTEPIEPGDQADAARAGDVKLRRAARR